MLQNPCKTLGFKKNMVYKIPPGGGEVNHIQPVAYKYHVLIQSIQFLKLRLLKPNISQDNPQSYLSVTYDK